MRNPIVHVAALSESVYYPLVVEYGPEAERLADIMGRMHWIPSYVDRAIRMVKNSAAIYTEVSAEINEFTIQLVRDELADRVDGVGDEQLTQAYTGMKKPVLDSLEKLQKFLEKDLPKKSKRTWRVGDEQYERLFALAFHGLGTPEKASAAAKSRIDELRREMFGVAKPVYCENNEKDREICGPTKAEIAAAEEAEAERLRREEEEREKAEEEERKRKEEEERKRKEEEERKRKEEEEKKKAEEEKKKAEEEKAKKEKEKAEKEKAEKEKAEKEKEKAKEKKKDKKDKDIFNPYGGDKKKKKEDKKDGPTNPYGFLLPPPAEVAGAKVAPQGDKAKKKKAKKKGKADKKEKDKAKKGKKPQSSGELDNVGGVDVEDATDAMIQKVVSWTLDFAAKEAGNGGAARPRIEEFLPEMADLARRVELLSSVKSSGVAVVEMPACLSALGHAVEFVPQPVFQPDQGGHVFVASGVDPNPTDWDDARLRLVAAIAAVPGQFEAYHRVSGIEMQTRRAVRALYADQAFVKGWSLYSTALIAAADDSWIMQLGGLAQLLTAATELVVDVELHTGGMSDKEAVKQLTERAFMSDAEAEARAKLAKISPTVLAASFLGYQGWLKARGDVRKQLKKGFSRKGFHERALDVGPVPMGQLSDLLGADDPDALPEYEAEATDAEEPEKTTFSFIDAF